MSRVYFDNAATTPINEQALAALVEESRALGNPSSLHSYGRNTRKDLESSREKLAALIGAHSSEIIFTGSGTEANNLALKGIFWKRRSEDSQRNTIVISAFEHHAVLDPAEWLVEFEGAQLIKVPVDKEGRVDLDYLNSVVAEHGDEIALISIMHSNNEIGTLQAITRVVDIANSRKIPVHTDAVQSFGKVPLNFAELGVFAMTLSAHKVGGPIGVGALVLKKGHDITPILHGGGQEREIRSGTLNAPAAVAFTIAADDAVRNMERNSKKLQEYRTSFINLVMSKVEGAWLNGIRDGETLPTIVNIGFPRTESDALLLLFDSEGIACSTGSACSAGVQQPSHVLLAMGLSETQARSSLRFSFGPQNSSMDLDYFDSSLKRVIDRAQAAYRGKP